MKLIVLKPLFHVITTTLFFMAAPVLYGQRSLWNHQILGELYVLEFTEPGKLYYEGQSLRYQVTRSLGERFSIGLETGLFVHRRPGELSTITHCYTPLQLAARFNTSNERFGVSLSTGYPLFFSEPYYFGSNGFWYRSVDPIKHADDFEQLQLFKIDAYYLVSNLRFNFLADPKEGIGVQLGFQHYLFANHLYNGGHYVIPGRSGIKLDHCFNLLLGFHVILGYKKQRSQAS